MYKVKIINYQPYEYQLLQNLLNDMSNQGYHTHHLSLITFFKKTDEKSHYIVDLFSSTAQSHYDKNIDKQKFLDPYIEKDYQLIYQKKEIFVLKGEQTPPTISWKKHENIMTNQSLKKRLLWALLVFIITIAYLFISLQAKQFNTFLTYGSEILYIGLIGLLLGISYKLVMNYINNKKLQKAFESAKKTIFYPISQLKKYYILFHIYIIIVVVMISGGFIEDMFNQQTISLNQHPQITLKELGIQNPSTITYTKKSSWTVPHSYQYLETTRNDKNILLVREYQFSSEEKAIQIFDNIKNHPELFSCDQIKSCDSLKNLSFLQSNCSLLGSLNNNINTVFMHYKKSVYIVASNKTLSSKQIQLIIHQYLS